MGKYSDTNSFETYPSRASRGEGVISSYRERLQTKKAQLGSAVTGQALQVEVDPASFGQPAPDALPNA